MNAVFEVPSFTFWNVAYTAIGASVYWGTRGRTKLKPYLLPDIVKYLPAERYHPLFEFILFIVLGCLVGIAFVSPTNARQALTAGFGWTGVFAHRKT